MATVRLYPFPEPRIVVPLPPPSVLEAMTRRQARERELASWNFWICVRRWLGRCGFRYIRDRIRETGGPPEPEALADWMQEIAMKRGRQWIVSFYDDPHPGPYQIAWEDLPEMAASAATWALSTFDTSLYIRAANGGRKSRRGPTYQPEVIDDLAALSKHEQAARLGCSERTIARLRAARLRAAIDSSGVV